MMDAVSRLIVRAAIDSGVTADKAALIAERFNQLVDGGQQQPERVASWTVPLLERFDMKAPKDQWRWRTIGEALEALGSTKTDRSSLSEFGRYLADSFDWQSKRSNGRKVTLMPPIAGEQPKPTSDAVNAGKYPIETLGLREHLDIPYDRIGNRLALQNNIRTKAAKHNISVAIQFIDPLQVCRVHRIG